MERGGASLDVDPRRPLLGPLDATAGARGGCGSVRQPAAAPSTSTRCPASWSTGWSAGLIPFRPYKLRVRVRVALGSV